MQMIKLLYVGIGGFIGACLRYGISLNASKIFGTQWPYGTLIVNVMGGIFIGLLMELSVTTELISPEMKLLLITGLLGGLTTFSTFSYETVTLFYSGSYILGIANAMLNLLLGFGGVVLGKTVAHIF